MPEFFFVAHVGAAVLIFSARFGAACFTFVFCSTSYVRILSHLSLLGFVSFVFFTLRCHLFFILRCQLLFVMNSCAFLYYLSFLIPDEASGRNDVNTTACCSTDCLLIYNIRPYYPSNINAGTSSLLHTLVQPLSSFLRASVLPSSASTLPSV